jgi:hypothetical protein
MLKLWGMGRKEWKEQMLKFSKLGEMTVLYRVITNDVNNYISLAIQK